MDPEPTLIAPTPEAVHAPRADWRPTPRGLVRAIAGLLAANLVVLATHHDANPSNFRVATDLEVDGDLLPPIEVTVPTIPGFPEVTVPPIVPPVVISIPTVTVPPILTPNTSLLGKILFHSRRAADRPAPTTGPVTPSGEGYNVWVMDADGGHMRQLTHGGRDGQPDLSADGLKVAWVSGADDEIWTMDANGANARRVATCPLSCGTPRWSPTGDRLAYVTHISAERSPEGPDGDDVIVMRADGSSPRRYATDIAESALTWAPDGTRLAVNAYYSMRGLYVLDVAAGTLTKIVEEQAGSPDWSPDGTKILWDDDHSRLVTVAPDGSNLTRLTPWDQQRMGGRWMPDGQHIVYGHYAGEGKIAIMNADGTGERFLTDGVDDDADPAV